MSQSQTFSLTEKYQFIELTLIWEGQINASTLSQHFSISRPTAAKDLKSFQAITQISLEYSVSLKCFITKDAIKPNFSRGTLDEYWYLNNSHTHSCEHLFQLDIPYRNVSPQLVRPLVQAIKRQKQIDIGYASVASPDYEDRIIQPHSLVFDGVRWHVRAYCNKNSDYRDFVLSRFNGEYEFEGDATHTQKDDEEWNKWVELEIQPDPRLSDQRQRIIELDYQMEQGVKCFSVRAALVKYLYLRLRLDHYDNQAQSQQIILTERSYQQIKPFLPS